MDGNAKLTNTTLRQSLNVACAKLAHYLEAETGEITAKQISVLPDATFDLAVYAGWIPEPTGDQDWPLTKELDADRVWLGQFVVRRTFREEFIALIQETLDEVEPYNEEIGRRKWREEAESEMHLEELRLATEEYRRLSGVSESEPETPAGKRKTPKELIDLYCDVIGIRLLDLATDAGVGIATVHRIRAGKCDFKKHRESLKAVASVIGCDWQQLIRPPSYLIAK